MGSPSPLPGKTALRRRLLIWYDTAQRHLPWREAARAGDAYAVWVSEIMLQQTRVAVVEAYFLRFVRRFPTAAALAAATEPEVLALWSGLGYYRRARHLLAAAKVMAAQHGGKFPATLEAALALPGVGAYTAGAVLSMAAGQVLPAVDGNVARIASRLTGAPLSPAQATPLARAWVDPQRPGDFNQALMDLGAMICTPRHPQCGACPLHRLCATRGESPRARPAAPVRRVEEHFVLATSGARVWLCQRPPDAAQLAGLWELPPATARRIAAGEPCGTLRHAITTRRITAHFYRAPHPATGAWMSAAQASHAPLTGLTRKALLHFLDWPL